MINNYGCTPDDGKPCIAIPASAEPIASMLSMANDLTLKAMDVDLHISSQVLGNPMLEMNTNEPKCMWDAVDKHVGDLRKELDIISKGLGV